MAAARDRVCRPFFRAVICYPMTAQTRRRFHDSSSASSDGPMLQKLLKTPISRLKATLESEFSDDSTEFPWPALLSSLNSSAPQKANLVLEWKLEKLVNGDRKNHDCYAYLIYLCQNIRNLPTAMFIFSSMEAQGIKPTSSIFNTLISTSIFSGNLLTALSLFEIMKGSDDHGPNSETYTIFISAYANLGNRSATEAWLAAKRASGCATDVQEYGFLVQCCVKSKAYEDAQRYFDEMMSAGLMPDERVLQNMLIMYCQQRNFCRVEEMLKFLIHGSFRIDLDVAKRIVRFYCELGLVKELEDLIVIFTESGQAPDFLALVYCSVIRLYADLDRLDDVEFSVGRMLKSGISFTCKEDVEKVICCYFRKEAYDRLDLFLECIKDSYKLTRPIYDLLFAGYRRAGLLGKLDILLKQMKLAGFA
ncbi:pentatricopeptide repeat-containing protein [Striga asiatica]|uniref:Pentatricopeptide repeat-containing protein n=1 Tax=Striga asiatica TaxID=4170 RepID=A0A5A7PND3_STRAF|nr:pentatricopeptide repeat-containing protein [Striga asiatica]